ncbi:hypothetical protein ACFQV2_25515 [Actinokineospora soli]|uniref:Uncharacterized protein n=1 Tax=Actinokineospora soli TaxID=1048753 RepID=A0ABW2TTL0_9PSEU
MPGVFRDSEGNYTYQTYNDYEERRRRDLDDARWGNHPVPAPTPTTPFRPAPPTPPAPEPAVVFWQPEPDPATTQLLAAADAAKKAEADRLWNTLFPADTPPATPIPTRVGDNPAFDAVFDSLSAPPAATPSPVEIRAALELLRAAARQG